MTTHTAIKESLKEIVGRVVAAGNESNEHLQTVVSYIEDTPPGPEFNQKVLTYLQPVATSIASKDIVAISNQYPDLNLSELYDSLGEADAAVIWQQLGMTNMLLTTMNMIPNEMLTKIEAMTNTMMGVLGGSGGSGGSAPDFGSLAQGLAGMMAPPAPSDKASQRERKRGKGGGNNKQDAFRNKLC
jgi:hypothetical protein